MDAADQTGPSAPTEAQVEKFTMLSPMLDSALSEMREFSKKKQDGIVNTTKIKLLNRLLRELKAVLSREPSTEYLDLLDEESLPQNGDAVLILGQYRAAMDSFKKAHFRHMPYAVGAAWVTEEYLAEHGGVSEEGEDEGDEDYDDEEPEEEDT